MIFLRRHSLLPVGIIVRQVPFNRLWVSLPDEAPMGLARAVQDAGWHFMWIDSDYSSTAWGLSDEAAITRAVARALRRTAYSFNAAELGGIRVSRRLGFRFATVTLHRRLIQQSALLGSVDGVAVRQLI